MARGLVRGYRERGLGQKGRARRIFRKWTHALLEHIEQRFFDSVFSFDTGDVADAIGRGYNRDPLEPETGYIFPAQAARPPVFEPFLAVHIAWGDADATEEWVGELDRATDDVQIHARVSNIGDPGLGYDADRRLRRVEIALSLVDVDGRYRARLTDKKEWVLARVQAWIGFRGAKRKDWWPYTPAMRIETWDGSDQRLTNVTLVDALEDHFGDVLKLPPVAVVQDYLFLGAAPRADHGITTGYATPGAIRSGSKTAFTAEVKARKIPVVFGREMAKPAWAWSSHRKAERSKVVGAGIQGGTTPVFFMVLGASRRKGWIKPHYWGELEQGAPDVELWRAGTPGQPSLHVRQGPNGPELSEFWPGTRAPVPLMAFGYGDTADRFSNYLPPGAQFAQTHDEPVTVAKRKGIVVYVDIVEYLDPLPTPRAFADTWHIAVMWAAIDTTHGFTDSVGYDFAWWMREKLEPAIEKDALVWRPPAGAEGDVSDIEEFAWNHDPAAVANNLIRYYGGGRHWNRLHTNDFSWAATGMTDRWTAREIADERPMAEHLADLCASFDFDLYRTPSGFIRCRPFDATQMDRLYGIPLARRITEADIERDTLDVTVPIGDERHGIATVFHYEGLKDVGRLYFPNLAKPLEVNVDELGRRLDRDKYITWREQFFPGDSVLVDETILVAEAENAGPGREVVTWTMPLALAMRLEVGDYVRMSHTGWDWDRELLRIEERTPSWRSRRQAFRAIRVPELDGERAFVLDDERYYRRTALGSVGVSVGSNVVTGTGTTWQTSGVTIGDIFRIPGTAATAFAAAVTAINSQTEIELDANAPANGSGLAYEILRSYVTPPDYLQPAPGAYPKGKDATDIYGFLCDGELTSSEGTLGAMSAGGDPGYPMR